jgi:hypothetical protein
MALTQLEHWHLRSNLQMEIPCCSFQQFLQMLAQLWRVEKKSRPLSMLR